MQILETGLVQCRDLIEDRVICTSWQFGCGTFDRTFTILITFLSSLKLCWLYKWHLNCCLHRCLLLQRNQILKPRFENSKDIYTAIPKLSKPTLVI